MGWHPVNDNAQGTASYGTVSTDATGSSTFSVEYKEFAWNNMLMASGDLSMWVMLSRATVEKFDTMANRAHPECVNCELNLLNSSAPGCFTSGLTYRSGSATSSTTTGVASAAACQALCQQTTSCKHFTYFPSSATTDGNHHCFLHGS